MREFAFELLVCAALEADGALVARQLGTGVCRPGHRIADAIIVEPGPGFDARARLTSHAIPGLAIDADVGVGRWRNARSIFPTETHPDRAAETIERAVDIGFYERDRSGGKTVVRQTARYPDDWFGRIIAIENKPDLATPGNLSLQVQHDVSLGLVDAVILTTQSHVTRAHLNRLPDEVGVWRFHPDTGDRETIREPTQLSVYEPGIEILDDHPGGTDITPVPPAAKPRARRRLAERAYGKGWRTYPLPACAHLTPTSRYDVSGLPYCGWHDRLIDPATTCSPACPGHTPADTPRVDLAAARDRTAPWLANPPPLAREQAQLRRWG